MIDRKGGPGCDGAHVAVSLCVTFPFLTLQFPDETLRSSELLNMIVAVIDSAQ
ncbi:hypothetical protein chiPu_0027974, partial [Chiloscyllium punctatum]|nr:hypothetical protein [Chiloscyllium punctatum]